MTQVDRVAQHRIVEARGGTQIAHRRLSRVDAKAQLAVVTELLADRSVDAGHTAMAMAALTASSRVIDVKRGVPKGHQTVAHVLVYRPLVVVNDLRQRRQDGVEDPGRP